jgi:N-acyl-D-amino-acid deacylase
MYVVIPDRDYDNRKKWEVALDEIGGADHILVTSYRPDSSLDGKTVAEIATLRKSDPVTTIIDMIHTAGPNIGIIATAMDEKDLERLVADPRMTICSDGGLSGAHPRGYGAFPRVLGVFVRDRGVITLAEGIAKMTSRSAALLGFQDRGVIAKGKKADIVVLDPARVADRGTKLKPAQDPVGIPYVIVNGVLVLDDGHMTDARPGHSLRRTGWQAPRATGAH